jgi:lipoprotein-anchoring transpeptidase ErfK/SrfK
MRSATRDARPPGDHRKGPLRRLGTLPRWASRAVLGVGAAMAAAGVFVLVAAVFGRPSIRVSSSPTALASLRPGGLGAQVTVLHAEAGGRPLAVTDHDGGLWPARALPPGQAVRVTAAAAAPSWLHWMYSSPVTATSVVRTPKAAPLTQVSLASSARRAPVRFTTPVTAVTYQAAGGPLRRMRFGSPVTVANVPVPGSGYAGMFRVAATARAWERLPPARTVSWFVPPVEGKPAVFVTPSPGQTSAAWQAPITLTFSEPVARVLGAARPVISPQVPGHWSQPGPDTLVFTPAGFGFGPGTQVTVRFGHAVPVVSASGGDSSVATTAMTAASYTFSTGPGSVLRIQQILARLGYLPVTFTPAPGTREPATMAAEERTANRPLAGKFSWRWSGLPSALVSQWVPGHDTTMTKGALMTFKAAQGTYNPDDVDKTLSQMADRAVWMALLKADLQNQRDPYPYSYVYVSKALPETLTLWENGKRVLSAAVNTGISVEPTANGTYPMYLRTPYMIMRGYNPNGSYYADPTWWDSYFNGGDAVHGFIRAAFGYPQSLGCVELPPDTAKKVYSVTAIGDLVTVTG